MRPPIVSLAWRLATANKRLTGQNARLAAALAQANRTSEEAIVRARAWQARAELLYAAVPPGMVDTWLEVLSEIENLRET